MGKMKYLIFDFETTGVGEDKQKGYVPYEDSLKPLPRKNFPVEIAMQLCDENGNVMKTDKCLIKGAERLDPWVLENCSHLSVKECEREGVEFEDILKKMVDMIGTEECTLVAHNIQYDWNEVMVVTAREKDLYESPIFQKLKKCPQFCTCVNKYTQAEQTRQTLKSYYFENRKTYWTASRRFSKTFRYRLRYSRCS